jgi:hypothetical protein
VQNDLHKVKHWFCVTLMMADKDLMELSFLDVPSFGSDKVKWSLPDGPVGSWLLWIVITTTASASNLDFCDQWLA